MKYSKYLILFALFLFSRLYAYQYEKIELEDHLVHVITADLNDYELKLINCGGNDFTVRCVDEMAKEHGGVVAINAGFFLDSPNLGQPAGVFYSKEQGMMKNGPKLRGAVGWNGEFHFGRISELTDDWLCHDYVIGGAPLLLVNGEIQDFLVEKTLTTFLTLPHARSAIGINEEGMLVLVKAEGHRLGHEGFVMDEWVEFLKSIGLTYALNLDGGSASSLFLEENFITEANRPVGNVLILVEKT